jgi:hypothetical protein
MTHLLALNSIEDGDQVDSTYTDISKALSTVAE